MVQEADRIRRRSSPHRFLVQVVRPCVVTLVDGGLGEGAFADLAGAVDDDDAGVGERGGYQCGGVSREELEVELTWFGGHLVAAHSHPFCSIIIQV
ncbi:hypothetical protein Ga0074812_10199 [Parafrankia irregularis]|uniref:Uncharacterized protein n=1 Tax=Parafrankia irregularis TaxID=795642 RepID=A0A0S4QDM2_9ACTN|nr:hypothetical protein Ga0074812_10199 [Parafrankia irregularis]